MPSSASKPNGAAGRPAVLVTGASGGIGRTLSVEFGRAGWHVGVHYHRNQEAAEQTLRDVIHAQGSAELYQADVREAASVQRMMDGFARRAGDSPCSVLICNAGIGTGGLVLRERDEAWSDTIAVNLTGTFLCLRAFAPVLIDRGGGSIVVIGSYAGWHGSTGQGAYGASKAGLIGLVKSAALEWGPYDIRVNLVLPGWQKTGLSEAAMPADGAWSDHALRRPPALEEVARTIVYVAQLKDMSGQVWNCDSRDL